MADDTMVEMVRDELRRSTDAKVGEGVTRAALQEATGLGTSDFEESLAALRATGEATEDEPDSYRYLEASMATPPEDEPEPTPELAGVPLPGRPPAQDDEPLVPGSTVTEVQVGQYRERYTISDIKIPRAVAAELSAQAIGEMLVAGIKTSDEGAAFIFEVTP